MSDEEAIKAYMEEVIKERGWKVKVKCGSQPKTWLVTDGEKTKRVKLVAVGKNREVWPDLVGQELMRKGVETIVWYGDWEEWEAEVEEAFKN